VRVSNDASSNVREGISVAFFGRRCSFTAIPFEHLLRAGINVTALFLSSSAPIGDAVRRRRYRSSISIGGTSSSVERLAGEHGIPQYDIRRPLGDELRSILRQHQPDLLVASCFPWRIPASIREVALLGGINLHPSLLPRFRGPDPLFWAYRTGESKWGVTVHQLSDSFDAGAILGQTGFVISDEMPGDQLERHAARLGGDLLLNVIANGRSQALRGSPQDQSDASYQTWPSPVELLVDRTWSVQRVINFIIGVRPLGYEPTIDTSRGLRVVHSARRANQETLFGETWIDEHTVCLSFADGVIEFAVE
jgi:methionyl-tRNA formyltransferase